MTALPRIGAFPLTRRRFFAATAGALGAALAVPHARAADEKPEDLRKKVEDATDKGLEYLKKTQAKDGHWEASNGAYHVAMTGLAGMALMMEGSNMKEGRYSDEVVRAVEWCQKVQQPNGLIASNRNAGDFGSYMHGHGYATMFLASAYGEAEDKEQLNKLEQAIKKAAEFSAKAQSTKKHKFDDGREAAIGGWGYTSAADETFDEGSITVTQLQALRAARNAGITVPRETIDKALAYLEACTTPDGGLIYSYASSNGAARKGSERPPITVAAVAGSFSAGQYKGELAKRWVKFCKEKVPYAKGRVPHDEYQSYYYAQVAYALGDDRYGQMFPREEKSDWLTWTKFKAAMYPHLLGLQDAATGEWKNGLVGPVFATAIALAILQLDKGILPIYQR